MLSLLKHFYRNGKGFLTRWRCFGRLSRTFQRVLPL